MSKYNNKYSLRSNKFQYKRDKSWERQKEQFIRKQQEDAKEFEFIPELRLDSPSGMLFTFLFLSSLIPVAAYADTDSQSGSTGGNSAGAADNDAGVTQEHAAFNQTIYNNGTSFSVPNSVSQEYSNYAAYYNPSQQNNIRLSSSKSTSGKNQKTIHSTKDSSIITSEDNRMIDKDSLNIILQLKADKDIDPNEISKILSDAEKEKIKLKGKLHEQDRKLEGEKITNEIQLALKQGHEFYQKGELYDAEREYIKVLRPVLSKPSMRSPYADRELVKGELLDSLYHLGEIYLANKTYTDNFAKATEIFQYCAAFADKYDVEISVGNENAGSQYFRNKAYSVEKDYLASIGIKSDLHDLSADEYYTRYHQRIESKKEELQELRNDTTTTLKELDISDPEIEERSKLIRDHYSQSTKLYVDHERDSEGNLVSPGLLQRLLKECYDQIGPVPEGCKYSVIGLGSLSRGTMTPWSDIDFAILINEEREEYKEYFRKVTKLLYIKILNFGETHLKSRGVEALNNFKTGKPEDEWFWDDVMKIKFSYDTARWNASKLPLGRQEEHIVRRNIKDEVTGKTITIEETKPTYELIHTPETMAKFQKEENGWFETDKHLVQSLRSVILIDGDNELLSEYHQQINQVEDQKIIQQRSLSILQQDIEKFSLRLGDKEEGKSIDIKQGIYRLGDIVICELANYYGISEENGNRSVWEVINFMQSRGVISSEGAKHLTEAVSIAAELRLRAYANSDSREEMLSTYEPATAHLKEQGIYNAENDTAQFKNLEVMKRFYYTMLKLQKLVKKIYAENPDDINPMILAQDRLYDDNPYYQFLVSARFLDYKSALNFIEFNIPDDFDKIVVLEDRFFFYQKTGKFVEAVEVGIQMIEALKNDDSIDPNHSKLAIYHNNLGIMYSTLADYIEAIEQYEAMDKIRGQIYQDNVHLEVAHSYNSWSNLYIRLGQYEIALVKIWKAYQITKTLYKDSPHHPELQIMFSNLGNLFNDIGRYDLADKYHLRALGSAIKYYRNNPNHPDIAGKYQNYAALELGTGKFIDALAHSRYSLDILKTFYTNSPIHPDIAENLVNLGVAYLKLHKYDYAREAYNNAWDIYQKVYGDDSGHPSIILLCNNFGALHKELGLYNEAKQEFEIAHEMLKTKLGNVDNHPDLALAHLNKGVVSMLMGDYGVAEADFKIALSIYQNVFGKSSNHPLIAQMNHNLGELYTGIKGAEYALPYLEQALENRLEIYKANPFHPSICLSYQSLVSNFVLTGDIDKLKQYINELDKFLKRAADLNQDTPEIASIYNTVGNILFHLNAYDLALLYHTEGLNYIKEFYSENHPDMATTYNNLAADYGGLKDFYNALLYSNKALEVLENCYQDAPNHQHIARHNFNLGLLLYRHGKYDDALQYASNSLEKYEYLDLKVDRDRSEILMKLTYMQMGNIQFMQGNLEKAKEYYLSAGYSLGLNDESMDIFIDTQITHMNAAIRSEAYIPALRSLDVLFIVDPHLRNDNYHFFAALAHGAINNQKLKYFYLQMALQHQPKKDVINEEIQKFQTDFSSIVEAEKDGTCANLLNINEMVEIMG